MGLILARSPFYVSNEGFDIGASLLLEIGVVDSGGATSIEKTYNLNFKRQTELDISELIMGEFGYRTDGGSTIPEDIKYVITTVSGEIGGIVTSDEVNTYFATQGYFEYQDGYNKDFTAELRTLSTQVVMMLFIS